MDSDYLRLNVTGEDTLKSIEKKYKILAKQLHPDKGGDTEEFQKLKESYDSILKEKSQKKYRSFNDSYLQRDYINLVIHNRFQRIDNLKR